MLHVLLVEDDPDVRAAVAEALRDDGQDVSESSDGQVALDRIAHTTFDVLITDVRIPRLDGLSLFRKTRALSPRTAVILMTSFATAADAVTAMKEGARDYLTKPFDTDELLLRVRAIDEKLSLERALEDARAKLAALDEGATADAIVGASPPMTALLDRLATVAASDAPVLVTGESGTGKELVARRLHALSERRAGPFVAVNCAAFPETLLEAELFGHERGAFTGAVRKRDGRFKIADGGTLLLDEVAEMPLQAQAKLLRVLQEGSFEPLGSSAPVRVDVRIVSATHRDLKRRIADGAFREDLYYRLNGVTLRVPPLRERIGDLPLLVSHFLRPLVPPDRPLPEVSTEAWHALRAYPYPGNVRELAHAVKHAVLLAHGGAIALEHLPADIVGASAATAEGGAPRVVRPLAAVIKETERAHLLHALTVSGGKRARAAELLGISRKNLWEKLNAHGIADSDIDDPLS